MKDESRIRVVVVGGGIAGLTAAYLLAEDPTLDVLLLEGSPRVGGKLRLAEVAGVTVDVGAEAMLNRRPEGVELARELGLEIVHPTSASSRLWTRGELRPLPRSLMGVPLDLDGLAASGVLSDEGLAHVRAEPTPAPDRPDERRHLRGRPGRRTVRRRGRRPPGRAATRRRVRRARTAAVRPRDHPAAGLPAGARRLTARGRRRAAHAATTPCSRASPAGWAGCPRPSSTPTCSPPAPTRPSASCGVRATAGFELVVGSTRDPETISTDAVVLATPAAPTARLLADLAPTAAAELAAVEYASMAVVTLAFHAKDAADHLPDSSGFLVPPVDGRRIKASTFSFAKWDWVREAGLDPVGGDDLVLLRTSLGRHREEAALQATDDELVASSLADLADGDRAARPPGRHPRPALGRRAPAVRRRAPRPGRADPRRRGPGPGAGGLRGGVRRRRHPGRDRVRPPGGPAGRRSRRPRASDDRACPRTPCARRTPAASLATYGPGRPEPMVRPSTDSTGVTPPMVPVTNTSSAL